MKWNHSFLKFFKIINGSFGEIINEFQDCNIKKTLGLLKEKKQKLQKTRIPFY